MAWLSRRSFLRVAGAGMATAAGLNHTRTQVAAGRKPNVLLIFADDQGTLDLNCYGAKDLITPNLDGLAERGVRFSQFYVASPVCSPSRAALLTGRYPQRAQLAGNTSSQPGHAGMPTTQITMAELFKAGGYKTAHIGKWHLGYTPETMPNQQGFDYSFGHMGGCIDNYSHFFYWSGPNRHDLHRNGKEVWHDGEYFGDLMVQESKGFISEHKEEPFFMYWAINMPHYPLQAKAKWREAYKDLPEPRNMYAAFVSTLDEMIGEVLEHLEESGLREDTIVVFLSDHGHSVEERTFGGGGWAGDYRGHKFTLWEGGIRVPCIISWPQHFPENEVREQMACSIDWYPTLAEACGIPAPRHKIDGKSILKVITKNSKKEPHPAFHWQLGRQWAVREGQWKLVYEGPASVRGGKKIPKVKYFLSKLDEDSTETVNLAEQHPEKVKHLTQLHREWAKTARDQ